MVKWHGDNFEFHTAMSHSMCITLKFVVEMGHSA